MIRKVKNIAGAICAKSFLLPNKLVWSWGITFIELYSMRVERCRMHCTGNVAKCVIVVGDIQYWLKWLERVRITRIEHTFVTRSTCMSYWYEWVPTLIESPEFTVAKGIAFLQCVKWKSMKPSLIFICLVPQIVLPRDNVFRIAVGLIKRIISLKFGISVYVS